MKKILAGVLVATSSLMFSACGTDPDQNYSEDKPPVETTGGEEVSGKAIPKSTVVLNFDSLDSYVSDFKQLEYQDPETNLSIKYNLFLPEGYSESKTYPLVVFIADASCVGDDPIRSLNQGRGALVWASKEWQSQHECIVAVPTYPEVILDDHGSYTTTPYIELTRRFIEDLEKNYSVDRSRIYGTGQSMGCMTTMLLAATHPDLYSAIMPVDGQWDVESLKGLESQKFIYFAAEDDERAFQGLTEVTTMFDKDWIEYGRAEWDGNSTPEELAELAQNLFAMNRDANFVTWKTGTIKAKSMGGNASYHMGSFDYAYGCVDAMEWIFAQRK